MSELVRRAEELKPLLEANAAETDASRRVVEANVEAVREAGLCRIMVPRRYAGYETDLRTFLEVMSTLGEACGSTAWAMSLINVCAWLVGLYPKRAQDEVWGVDPDAWTAGSLSANGQARLVDGGLVVSGRWPWSSGSLHAQWAVGGARVVDETGEEVDVGLVLMPMTELAIEDTWFVAGMRGTGSNTLVAEDVFVPEHRYFSYPKALAGEYRTEFKDEALYRSAFVPVTVLVLISAQLGLARAALELVREKAYTRAISHTLIERQADSAGFQVQLADVALRVDSAHLHAFRGAADIDEAAARGVQPEPLQRARIRADTAKAARLCREAIDMLVSAHGASSFADANRLQRIWRDQHVASRHAIIAWVPNLEIYGKVMLGIEPNITQLV